MNGQLTISGVFEERSEGRYMQKQFEKSFDVPATADLEAMAAYITPAHMLVVEIPLNPNQHKQAPKVDHLNVNAGGSNQRRLSFSLDKFNTLNNQNPFSQPNGSTDTLPPPSANQQIRRTSITKTTTTTKTSGSGPSGLPADLAALLSGGDAPEPSSPAPGNDRRGSTIVPHQIIINEPPSSPAANDPSTSRTVLTDDGTIDRRVSLFSIRLFSHRFGQLSHRYSPGTLGTGWNDHHSETTSLSHPNSRSQPSELSIGWS